MKDPLTRLTEKTAALGNYNRKYLHIISSNIETLTARLEQRGMRDRVHLWSYSMEIPGEMDTVLEVASDDSERLNYLGCYYALQFLHLNLRMVDVVKLELAASTQRPQTGRKLMLEAGRMFRHLTKCLMERLLDIILVGASAPEFVMLGVGTRADQDDIDLGIVHRRPADSEILNRAIGRLSSQMFKKATRLHFHLSEHVGENSLTATIEQYEEILAKDLYDFVIVTEMLGAAVILGSYPLYEQFKSRVTKRFYYDPRNKVNRYHEGYLRGMLSDIQSLLTRPKPSETINPKDDGLRAIKGLLTALKLVHGVDKVNAWNIIDELKERNPERRPQYGDLEQSLSFFELFRHLYQIMVAQDEDIGLNELPIEAMVARIAEMMGFEKKGVVSAKDFMLVNYYEFLDKSVKAVDTLTGDLRKHLREVSVYKPIFSGDIHRKPDYEGNLAADFIEASAFAGGIIYWDDFLEELSDENKPFYDEFVDSFHSLPEATRANIARAYISGTKYDAAPILRFLVTIGRRAKSDEARSVFSILSRMFIDELNQLTGAPSALVRLSNAHPGILNSFLALLEWDSLAKFMELAQLRPALPELVPFHKQLLALSNVHYQSSHFFKRHFHPILNKYPIYIKNLHNDERLREITAGFYSDLTSLAPLSERLERLGDYYDLEFVRVSMLAMGGAGCMQTDAEFVEFCDNYTLSLYEFCLQDLHLSLGYSMQTHDLFALYATGGHAREQGFDDDYDMIVILDSTDAEEIDYCNKIVAKMNAHILKRGILPHHRFADHFGSYVVSLDELAEHLGSEREALFVDQSQVLSSRMLVGTSKLEGKLRQNIIDPLIFSRGREYIGHMKEEMKARHVKEDQEQRNSVKECRGGLRDIEMLLLMYKAKYRVREPLSRRLLSRLVGIEPGNADKLASVEEHLNFIKNLRDLYRLKVAAHNVINREYLPPVAATMGYGEGTEGAQDLYDDFLRRTEQAGGVIEGLVAGMEA